MDQEHTSRAPNNNNLLLLAYAIAAQILDQRRQVSYIVGQAAEPEAIIRAAHAELPDAVAVLRDPLFDPAHELLVRGVRAGGQAADEDERVLGVDQATLVSARLRRRRRERVDRDRERHREIFVKELLAAG